MLAFCQTSAIIISCRYGSLVERQLPKLERRVRFPLSAFFVAMHLCENTKIAPSGVLPATR